MRYSLALLLLMPVILFNSCKNITGTRSELGIPPSRVYFSFDDGPSAGDDTTARLLDVLEKYQVRALFSLLGENSENCPDLVKRIYNDGHCIINHGYADEWAWKMDSDEFRNNLILGEEAISAALGFNMNPKLYRPHGAYYYFKQKKIISNEGYTIVPVTVWVHDAIKTAASQKKIVRRIVRTLEKQGGGIVLLHDVRGSYSNQKVQMEKRPKGAFNRSWIPDAVEEVIIHLLEKDFILDEPFIYF